LTAAGLKAINDLDSKFAGMPLAQKKNAIEIFLGDDWQKIGSAITALAIKYGPKALDYVWNQLKKSGNKSVRKYQDGFRNSKIGNTMMELSNTFAGTNLNDYIG